MHFTQTLAAATLALAGAGSAKEIIVQVSNPDASLFYNKNDIKADVGDTVKFIFNPANHTVTESSFALPCQPLFNASTGFTGFNSGFQPTQKGAAEQSTFTYAVADTKPHWFYCAQGKHCQGGMVGVINTPAAAPQNNINSFAALAKIANATTPRVGVAGGWLGKISAADAEGYASQAGGASWAPPTANGTNAPTATPSLVYNTASAAPTVIQTDYTYTNSQGQAVVTSVAGTVQGWVTTTYTAAYTNTAANGAVETGVAVVTGAVPQIAQGGAAGLQMNGAAAAAGLVAGVAGAFFL